MIASSLEVMLRRGARLVEVLSRIGASFRTLFLSSFLPPGLVLCSGSWYAVPWLCWLAAPRSFRNRALRRLSAQEIRRRLFSEDGRDGFAEGQQGSSFRAHDVPQKSVVKENFGKRLQKFCGKPGIRLALRTVKIDHVGRDTLARPLRESGGNLRSPTLDEIAEKPNDGGILSSPSEGAGG